MEERKLTKEEIGNKVLFPRTQLLGLKCYESMPSCKDFNLEIINNVPNIGTAKLIVQQQTPHMVFQLIETSSEQQFDDYPGKISWDARYPPHISKGTQILW